VRGRHRWLPSALWSPTGEVSPRRASVEGAHAVQRGETARSTRTLFITAIVQHLSLSLSLMSGSCLLGPVFQERIMVEPFGEQQERFKFSLFLVLCNRLTTMTVALFGCLVRGKPGDDDYQRL